MRLPAGFFLPALSFRRPLTKIAGEAPCNTTENRTTMQQTAQQVLASRQPGNKGRDTRSTELSAGARPFQRNNMPTSTIGRRTASFIPTFQPERLADCRIEPGVPKQAA